MRQIAALSGNGLTLYHKFPNLTTRKKQAFENNVGGGENGGNPHFLLFPQCFLLLHREKNRLLNVEFVVCKCFQFDKVLNFVVW